MHKEYSSIKKRIYYEMLDDINNGMFPLDQFIKEGELIERFKVSKGPIREALIELCNEGILRSIPRVGYQVIQLTEKNVMEATELRLILEMAGLKKSAALINENSLNKLEKLNKECEIQMGKTPLTLYQHWEYNIQFHLLLNSFSGNSHINKVLNDTLRLIRRAYMQLYSGSNREAYAYMDLGRHIEIEKALKKGNIDEALELLKNDILFINGKLFFSVDDSRLYLSTFPDS